MSRQQPKIPVTLIAGFLGAGKTTLLNHILSENHGLRAAVLVNDFGAINIDAKLVIGVEGDAVSLANGCICCSIRDDLVGACLRLLERPDLPDHILVEMSGVSDPVPVLNTFTETRLADAFALSSILTVVDADQLARLEGKAARQARSQLEAADIVVLNKMDLVDGEGLDSVMELVRLAAPGSRIIGAVGCRVPLEIVFAEGDVVGHGVPWEERRSTEDRSHDHAFATWSWTSDRPLSLIQLRQVLEQLPETVYRCKGVVQLEEMPVARYVLQMVGKRHRLEESGSWGDKHPQSEIVLIGARGGFDLEELQDAFDGCVGTGDDSRSPVLRLVRKLAPELLANNVACNV